MEKEVIKFKLSGITACIRKPESNSIYFTYNNPHKMTILGILGAIIGENGYNYNSFYQIEDLPDCYKNLKHLKIGVEPLGKYGNFSKKKQTFNNSVGYASKEEGRNLVVTEQWLENPEWNIYILSDNSEKYKKIKDYLINSKCEYIPYIGKNDHFATINEVKVLSGNNYMEETGQINSLIYKDNVDIKEKDLDDIIYSYNNSDYEEFLYNEVLPTELDKTIGYINYKRFIYTNKNLIIKDNKEIYSVNGKNVFFY